jgi:hypothetical protein
MKVYRYTKVPATPAGELDIGYVYKRSLWDALVIPEEGGMSSPLGPDEEFEVYVEDIE